MHTFFCSLKEVSPETVILKQQEQLHHLRDVLRLKKNEKVKIFDDSGNVYHCLINEVSKERAVLGIIEKFAAQDETRVKITIACALPKKSKMDDIIDKLTQLGVDRIIPMESERVVVKLDDNKRQLRKKRWEKIALSAAKQSQRSRRVVIDPLSDFKKVILEAKDYDLKIIPTLCGERQALRQVMDKQRALKAIIALIGPEGDFSAEEVELAMEAGFIPVSLGEPVLRVETAAVAVASFISLTLATPEHQLLEHQSPGHQSPERQKGNI